PSEVRVIKATGPYSKDDRSRYRYRSNPLSAQLMIAKQAQNGLLYLGEWHTHAEDCPQPSRYDLIATETLHARSRLNTNSIILAIIGRRASMEGIYLSSYGGHRWINWSPRALFA